MRSLLLPMLLLLSVPAAACAAARDVEVARLQLVDAELGVDAVRAAPEAQWVAADAMRRQAQPIWWRIRLTPGSDADSSWVLAIKETYDAELLVYLPPDYRAQALNTFDPLRRQIGSRHRLAVELAPGVIDLPVYVRLVTARGQPMRVSAAPLAEYIAQDLTRVRYTSMVLSALLLLGLVAAMYAVALRRWMLLLFCVWVLCSTIYVLVMSGEIVWMLRDAGVLQHAMAISSVAINVGVIAVYAFVIGFLDIPRHFPRLAWAMRAILVLAALMTLLVVVDPRSLVASQVINLSTLALSLASLGAAVARARAGSPQGWFFLLGWGTLTVIGMIRAFYFLRLDGTPDWLEWLHPLAYVFGAMVLVLATARAARYAEREMHVARMDARTDPLTRLPNRSQFGQGLDELLQHAQRERQPLSLMFLDLDRFKSINDRFGHGIGDACLAAVGRILRRHVRASDLIARYGGEEFVLVLEGADKHRAVAAAEELRAAVEEEGRELDGQRVALTASIGVTDYRPGDRAQDMLARADAALYRAKKQGRNRVVLDTAIQAMPRQPDVAL